MTRPVRLHPLAEDEVLDAWSWYEEQRPGLGDDFLAAVRSALDLVTRWPGSGSPTIEDHGVVIERRVSTPNFPYVLRYRVLDDAVVVMTVHHHRRHPGHGGDRSPSTR